MTDDDKPGLPEELLSQIREPIEGNDLKLFARWMGARDPGPLREAMKDPEFAAWFSGGHEDEIREAAKIIDEQRARRKRKNDAARD